MKNCRPCLTALSLFWFLWDIKEPTLLFVKCRGHRPWWCGTTVKWAGWEMNWDASLVSFPVPVLSHRGQFNKELEVHCNAWPSRSGFHYHHHHHHHVSSRQYARQASTLSDQHFLSCVLPSSSSPLCFTLSQPSVTWGLLWSLSAFGLPADFVPRASMLPQQ